MKELYVYTVNKINKKEIKTSNEDGTFTVTVENELIPTKVILKKPSRKDREDMSMVYNAVFHKCLSAGISTEEMIRRAVLDGGGGIISKPDLDYLFELYKTLEAKRLEAELKRIDNEDVEPLIKEMENIYKEIYQLESAPRKVFDHSAETIATRKSLTWAALNLTFVKNGKNYDPVFLGGATFESKLNSYYDMCDEEDKFKFELNCFDKSYAMLEKYLSGEAETPEDFKVIEEELDKFFNEAG